MVGPRGFQPLTPYSESVETHTNVMKKVEKLGGLFPQPQGHKKKKTKKTRQTSRSGRFPMGRQNQNMYSFTLSSPPRR